jgi:hypothetical protein
MLFAVDLGLRAGLATFDDDGRLRTYASRNFGTRTRLKRAIPGVLADVSDLRFVVVEGDRTMGVWWKKAATRLGARTLIVSPERWRTRLLLPRQQRNGMDAKYYADRLSRRVISWSGAAEPTSLRDDAAEAILIGLWGVLSVGWLARLPRELTGQ